MFDFLIFCLGTPSCGKTPTDQTETPHAESRRWLKSPSSPALPVTDHLAQGRARPSSGNSTPTHAGGQVLNSLKWVVFTLYSSRCGIFGLCQFGLTLSSHVMQKRSYFFGK